MELFLSVNGKNSQNAAKTELAPCMMLKAFLQECKCVILSLNAVRLAPNVLRRNPIENRAISGFSGQKSVPEQF